MRAIKVAEDVKPLSDLKTRAGDIVRQAEETGRPVIITRHGRGVAVVLSVAAYDEFQALAARVRLQRAIAEAERDVAEGRTVPHEEVVARWEKRLGVELRDED
jgi:prevent-host-death family protein